MASVRLSCCISKRMGDDHLGRGSGSDPDGSPACTPDHGSPCLSSRFCDMPASMSDSFSWLGLVGATLGVFNFLRALWANRPLVFLAPFVIGGSTDIRVNIVNMTKRPLLLRRIRAFPADVFAHGEGENRFDLAGFERGVGGSATRRYIKVLPADERTYLGLEGLKEGKWCLLIVTWSQGWTIWPWSVVWARTSIVNDLHARNP